MMLISFVSFQSHALKLYYSILFFSFSIISSSCQIFCCKTWALHSCVVSFSSVLLFIFTVFFFIMQHALFARITSDLHVDTLLYLYVSLFFNCSFLHFILFLSLSLSCFNSFWFMCCWHLWHAIIFLFN